MTLARRERMGESAERRAWRAGGPSRRTGRPLRIDSLDADPAEAAAAPGRVVLLRFEWRTSRDEIQPVLLALPELLD